MGTRPLISSMKITFYFAEGCWVCDSIRETLNGLRERYRLEIRDVNIAEDEETYALYRFDVPVVEFEDGSVLHGRIRKKDLMAKLELSGDPTHPARGEAA